MRAKLIKEGWHTVLKALLSEGSKSRPGFGLNARLLHARAVAYL
jgi:hypothetical protein